MEVPLSGLQQWAQYTASGGAVGATYGATAAFLRGQPVLFMASAYGVNCMLFTGAFLGARSALLGLATLQTAVPPERVTAACSATAAALTGAGFTAAVSGRGRAVVAAALWGCGGWAGQSSVDALNAWRRTQALAILRERLPPSELDSAAAVSSVATTPVAPPVSLDATPTESSGRRPWAWLPFRFGTDHSERLTALRRRLQEINEDLGEVAPPPPLTGNAGPQQQPQSGPRQESAAAPQGR